MEELIIFGIIYSTVLSMAFTLLFFIIMETSNLNLRRFKKLLENFGTSTPI